ncbi:retrovirus-related pol polyprotein from transposon TNT 1-94 [Tanacetum coccineum]
MTDYDLWEAIVNGDSPLPKRTVDGVEQTYPPTTIDEKLARKNELKARGTLLMDLPNEHQLKFNTYKCAKTLIESIEKRFGGNKEPKKTQKTLLKQQYKNFNRSNSEGLDQTYDRLQKLIKWKTHTLIWRNKPDLDTLSMDDLYKNLKIYETKVKGSSISNQNLQNVAFMSSNNSGSSNQAYGSNSANTDSMRDAATYSFFVNQSNSLQLNDEDLQQIDADNLEEMDLKWQMAILTMRARRFLNKTGRKISANGSETIGFKNQRWNAITVIKGATLQGRAYKAGLESVEARLDMYKKNEVIFEEDINILKLDIMLRDNALTQLRKKFEKVEKEKDDLKLTLEKFENSSKILRKLLEIQENDRYKTSEGYHVIPPPYTGNFMPYKSDLVLADEDEYVFSELVTSIPDVATSEAKTSESKPKSFGEPLIKDWISDSEDENETESKKKRFIDSGSLRHMNGNKSYLSDYEEIDGGFVAFRGSTKGGKITGKGRKPALSFTRPFGCPVTILNTLDHLGKFDGKADKGFFAGYSVNSKAFRVFNKWLFDINTLTKSMNYEPVVVGNQSNGITGTKAYENAGKSRVEIVPGKDYILLPFLTQDPPFSSSLKNSPNAGFKPSGEEEKKDAEHLENKDSEVPNTEEPRVNQEQDESVNSTNNINTVSSTVNTASIKDNAVDENTVYGCADDHNMPNLEEIVYLEDDEGVGAEADMSNLDTYMPMDVKSAFLYGKIEEEVYVYQPLGFKDLEFPDRVYKVEKALYGLHQALRAWYETLSTYLLDNGFQRDDIIFGSTKKSLCTKFEKLMHKKFQMRFMDKYVDEILKKFGFSTVKTTSTPMETSKPLMKDENAEDVDDPPFDFEAYTNSDYAGASLDRKSTTGEALKFIDSHNMVAYLEKSTENADFDEIVDFLNASPIRYALTSNDPPLSGVNTPRSGEDKLKIIEFMEICTKLSDRVLALENVKTTQYLEITSLKKRVKKLEKKKKARTPQLKRRTQMNYFIVQEDLETQGSYDQDIDVTTVNAPITTTGVSVSTAEPSTPPTTTTTVIKDKDLTIAQTLMKIKNDPIACLNKEMAFLTAVASSRFPSTNNQLITSSNPRNQATIQDGRVKYTMQVEKQRLLNATTIKVKDIWLGNALSLSEQGMQHKSKAVLMANISNYGSDVISKVVQIVLLYLDSRCSKHITGAVDMIFTRKAGNDLLLVQIYVDDIIFASTNTALCNEFANLMTTKFKMSMMGQMSFFLGLQISQSPRGIFLNQSKYASEIIKKYGLLTSDSVDTPMVEKSKLDEDLQGKPVDATLYRGMIGSLMYLTSSRPDLIYAVCLCAQYQAKPTEKHLNAVKQIF